ncbi:TonB-dependent receptor plug domain-containing protein [Derxia gummosa]|uniref:TonB-dependent receptor plug domain-containing protein n=1 Tax=Derxia gummosa DSM 723 TaxID=1121388 RepID=A0A8B6X6P0_9BURK|nr:TonB-dependent receptor [Derxia gummosa]
MQIPSRRQRLALLIAAIGGGFATAAIADDATSAFSLGKVEVAAPVGGPPIGTADVIDAATIQAADRFTVGDALTLTPGINIGKHGQRNEQVVYVRGFDTRQVQLFIDGIPVYVPYDGNVDLGRFTTFDLARIDISKGFSAMAYGSNTLGGAINLVSRRPVREFEGDAGGGIDFVGRGEPFRSRAFANVGTNQGLWYLQLGAATLDQDRTPLPTGYRPPKGDDGGWRDNSQAADTRTSVKLGLTPRAGDEYALSFIQQNGSKGDPPYAGRVASPAYWRWPYWNKDSVYLSTSTALGIHTVKVRAFNDRFRNSLFAYDDATYTTQNRPSSFQSWYDDYSNGLALQDDIAVAPGNRLSVAAQLKIDVHREHNAGEPWRWFKDRTTSLSIEDSHAVTPRLTLVAGLGRDARRAVQAEDYNSTTKVVSDFPRVDDSALNGQVGVFYRLGDDGRLHATVARKSRFPTIKDRYSYRLGRAIPNAGLEPERANHYEIGWDGRAADTDLAVAVFHSDISNLIQNVVFPSALCPNYTPAGNCQQAQNVGRVRVDGIELSADRRGELLDVGGNYTGIARKNRSTPTVRLTDVPRHRFYGFARLHATPLLDLTASVDAQGYAYSDSTGAQVANGFAIANLKAGWTVAPGVLIEAGVRNLFDRYYAYAEGFPELGRTGFVQGRVKF